MNYPLVRDLAAEGFPVRLTCGVSGVSAQACYAGNEDPVSLRDLEDAYAINVLIDAHGDDPACGYWFLTDEFERAGPPVKDDLLRRGFTATGPNRGWVADLIEHPTTENKVYCCAIKDRFPNRIVGHAISDWMTADLAAAALRIALARREPDNLAIIHVDRGSQSRARSFQKVYKTAGH